MAIFGLSFFDAFLSYFLYPHDDILGIVYARCLSHESVAHTFLADILRSCPPPLLAQWRHLLLLRRPRQALFTFPTTSDMSTSTLQAAASFVAACPQGTSPSHRPDPVHNRSPRTRASPKDIPYSDADVKEQAAALVWLRHTAANILAPDTWASLLSPTLLTNVCILYPIPPAKTGSNPAETDLRRLAKVVSPFMSDVPTSSRRAHGSRAPARVD